MSKKQLENFLDGVYCTGLNDGMYATRLPEDKADEILAKNVPEIDLIISGHTHTTLTEPIKPLDEAQTDWTFRRGEQSPLHILLWPNFRLIRNTFPCSIRYRT